MEFQKTENRWQFRFWLDVLRPEEKELAQYVETLKAKRHFAQTIRDALRLIQDLRQGRVTVLLALFPWIEDYFTKHNPQPATIALADPIREHMERMERYFSQLPALGDSHPPPNKPLLMAKTPLNDDMLEIKKHTSKGGNAGRILILQVWLTSSHKNISLFSQEDLELVTNHPAFNQSLIKAEMAKRKKESPSPTIDPAPEEQVEIKKIKGAEVEFVVPDFDDLALL